MPQTTVLTNDEKVAAWKDLRRSRCAVGQLTAPAESGVYAIYVRTKALLLPFTESADGLIYIGRSSNLASREFDQHFSSASTGFSTLRRSLGALLKQRLSLRAIPRAHGSSETNVRNYRFTHEARLTDWMSKHLEVGFHPSTKYLELESFLVLKHRPLLNLTKWPNPHRKEIKRLRKECAEEARRNRFASRR